MKKYHKNEIKLCCYEGLDELIDLVRMRQHDFNNQINAIMALIYTENDINKIRDTLNKYYGEIKYSSRYDKILTAINDPAIAGFLYAKFSYAESLGIDVLYRITVYQPSEKLTQYEMINILGILIDNAIEAVMEKKEATRKIKFEIMIQNSKNTIEVANICEHKKMNDFCRMFEMGYSTKGDNRGYGLYEVKKILNKVGGNILVSNNVIDDINWISFKLCDI